MKYVAFLRGINVGGNKPIKMDALRKALATLGLRNVATLLASGNVVFEAPSTSAAALARKIEKKLEQTFGHEVGVIVRTLPQMQALAKTDPFKNVKATPGTGLYVTFLPHKSGSGPHPGDRSATKNFRILRVTQTEVFSIVTRSPGAGTPEFMTALEKGFGKNITTRNWNTVAKILRA